MVRIVVTSDWHVDSTTAGFDRYSDVTTAVEEVAYRAIDWKADLFLFLGDLCDPDAARQAMCSAFAINVAGTLARAGVPSRWLVGNHDVIENGSGTSTLSPLAESLDSFVGHEKGRVYSGRGCERLGDVGLVALPFVPRSDAYDPAEYVRSAATMLGQGLRRTLVLSHLNCPGIVPASETHEMPRGREVWLPLDVIAESFPGALILQGHYHRQQIVEAEKYTIAIPGAPVRHTFGEADFEPGWLEVEV